MFQDLKDKIEILENTEENILKCVDKIENNELLIFPSENVYQIGCNCFSEIAVKNIYKLKKKNINQSLTLNVLDYDMLQSFVEVNNFEDVIIKKLMDLYWPGPLTFILKNKNKNLDHLVKINKNNCDCILITCPENESMQKIIKKTYLPIISTSANLSGKIPAVEYSHAIKYFKKDKITLLKGATNPKYCVENTVVSLEKLNFNSNKYNLIIEKKGNITKKMIQKSLSNFEIQIFYRTDLNKKEVVNSKLNDDKKNKINHLNSGIDSRIDSINFEKKIILFNFIESSHIKLGQFEENIKQSVNSYLSVCALIDFNSRNFKYRNKFSAYVDLSEKGDIKEALFNFYNVIHQLNEINEVKNILIFNYYDEKKELYSSLYDLINKFSKFSKTLIPLFK
tara:strand:- start:728 stop:1912 length:1185 start_codon:yes stop_codon:yes gene_type:complete